MYSCVCGRLNGHSNIELYIGFSYSLFLQTRHFLTCLCLCSSEVCHAVSVCPRTDITSIFTQRFILFQK